jgi:UDP-glucose-4-epimerase GalE
MNVLVTGGAGYIGSHACKALARAGYTPVVLDNLCRGHESAVRWGPLVKGDFGDPSVLDNAFRDYPIGAVIHFAAYAYVAESMESPDIYFRNNVASTINLLDAMRRHAVPSIVFSSSCATYGIPSTVPIRENHTQVPINAYGESKLMAEKVIRWYGKSFGLSWAVLRYFNAAGADPEGELGEDHEPEPHLLPRILQAAAGLLPHIDIFGTDYATPDGTAVRDYVHVSDLAQAHLKAMKYLSSGGTSEAFNLGTGKGCSVREVVTTAERVTQKKIPTHECARREGDPAELVADPSKVRGMLDWNPRHSELATMLETAWQWMNHKSQKNADSDTKQPAAVADPG